MRVCVHKLQRHRDDAQRQKRARDKVQGRQHAQEGGDRLRHFCLQRVGKVRHGKVLLGVVPPETILDLREHLVLHEQVRHYKRQHARGTEHEQQDRQNNFHRHKGLRRLHVQWLVEAQQRQLHLLKVPRLLQQHVQLWEHQRRQRDVHR